MKTPGLDRGFYSLMSVVCILVLGGAIWMLVQAGGTLRESRAWSDPLAVSVSLFMALAAAAVAGGALWFAVTVLRMRTPPPAPPPSDATAASSATSISAGGIAVPSSESPATGSSVETVGEPLAIGGADVSLDGCDGGGGADSGGDSSGGF